MFIHPPIQAIFIILFMLSDEYIIRYIIISFIGIFDIIKKS